MKFAPLALIAMGVVVAGCGGGAALERTDVATEAEWRALRTPAIEPLPGAPAVTVYEASLVGRWPDPVPSGVSLGIGVSELVTAGLMRRRDVAFVERRRFTPAAEAERQGIRRAPGTPAAGVSPPLDFAIQSSWVDAGGGRSTAEVQLLDPGTGQVLAGTRVEFGAQLDPVTLARAIVRASLDLLDGETSRPAWTDPAPLPNVGEGSGVESAAIDALFSAVAAEDRWRWDAARRGFVAAAADPAFLEASILLGRTARLRLGGTLAEN